jgi:ATP-dependent Clp protease ATP-binding subunit ClpC
MLSKTIKRFWTRCRFWYSCKNCKCMIILKVLLKMRWKNFAPEFLNRIDDVIVFNTLETWYWFNYRNRVEEIICSPNGTWIQINSFWESKSFYCRKGFDKQFGARPLKEPFKNTLKTHLLKRLLLKFLWRWNSWILKKELKN